MLYLNMYICVYVLNLLGKKGKKVKNNFVYWFSKKYIGLYDE